MKIINKLLALLAICFVLLSCNQGIEGKVIFTEDSFPKSFNLYKIDSISLINADVLDPIYMRYHPKGYLLFLDRGTENLVKILNIKSGAIQKMIKKGRGPEECVHISTISVINNSVYLHGSALRKMLKLEIDSSGIFQITKCLNLGVQAGRFVALSNNLFAGTTYTKDRIGYYNNKGKFLYKTGGGPLNIDNCKDKSTLPNILFQTKITTSANGKYIALANMLIDVLEIYSNKGDTISILRGPDGIKTKVTSKDVGVGRMSVLDPFFFAYRDIKSFSNEIWVSYSGIKLEKRKMPDYNKILPNKIYCFSWQGEPIRKIELENKFSAFAIDYNNLKLYCLEKSPIPKIVIYDIKNIINH